METLNNEHPETLEEKAPYFLVDIWNEGKKNTLMPRGQGYSMRFTLYGTAAVP